MIKYEQMPPSAQKNYNMTNKVRVVSMFVGIAITLIWIIRNIITGHNSYASAFVLGGVIHYFIHSEFLFKKLTHSLGLIGILVYLFISIFGIYTGWLFLIADLILFLLKKPCIYPFENKYFILTEKAQEEINAMNYEATINAFAQAVKETGGADTVKGGLEQLKEMLDNGLITESEYEAKKVELLKRL